MSNKFELYADSLKAGQWVCMVDPESGELGRFVKVEAVEAPRTPGGHSQVLLLEENSMDRWGTPIEGDCEWHTLPIYGQVQA